MNIHDFSITPSESPSNVNSIDKEIANSEGEIVDNSNKVKEALRVLFENTDALKNDPNKSDDIDRVYRVLNNSELNILNTKKSNDFLLEFALKSFFLKDIPDLSKLFDYKFNINNLTKDRIKQVNELFQKQNVIKAVILFLQNSPSKDSLDYYSPNYPDIYRSLWSIKDDLIKYLEELNKDIDNSLQNIMLKEINSNNYEV